MGVGTKIKAILKEQKKTIKQLAEESGVPVNTLYSITKRDSEWVTPVVLEKVSQALSVPLSAIMPDVPDVIKKSALEFAERTAAQNRALEKKGYLDDLPENERRRLTDESAIYQREIAVLASDPESAWKTFRDSADVEILRVFQGLKEHDVEARFLAAFQRLNRMGKLQALLSLEALCEIPRYTGSYYDEVLADLDGQKKKEE